MREKYAPIFFASQIGGKDALAAVGPAITEIEDLAKADAGSHYGDPISSIAFVFRVDGAITQWGLTGCERPMIDRKQHYVTIDVGIPSQIWKGQSIRELRQYISSSLRLGWNQLELLIKREGINFDCNRASRDIDQLCSTYNLLNKNQI